MTSSSPDLALTVSKTQIGIFFPLLQQGVEVPAIVGCSIESLLCDQFGLRPEYLAERISTIFLDGRPVDDVHTATVKDGASLALSAAMPGLAGATLRRSGCLAALRGSITYQNDESDSAAARRKGEIKLKLFNLLLKEMGAPILERGLLVRGEALRRLLSPHQGQIPAHLQAIRLAGRDLNLAQLQDLDWIDPETRYRLTVKASSNL